MNFIFRPFFSYIIAKRTKTRGDFLLYLRYEENFSRCSNFGFDRGWRISGLSRGKIKGGEHTDHINSDCPICDADNSADYSTNPLTLY